MESESFRLWQCSLESWGADPCRCWCVWCCCCSARQELSRSLFTLCAATPLSSLNVTGVCRCSGCSTTGVSLSQLPESVPPLVASAATWQGRTLVGAAGEVTWDWEGVAARIVVGPGASDLSMLAAFTTTAGGAPGFRILLDDESVPPAANITLPVGPMRSVPLLTGIDPSRAHNVTIFYQTDPVTLVRMSVRHHPCYVELSAWCSITCRAGPTSCLQT